jgi:predicted NBD/HSP70 family sugar kinase
MSPGITGTPPLVRVVNRHLILDRVRRFGRISRAELAKLTAIRPPTVSAVVRQLLREGLIEEIGDGSTNTGTGRPPRMVALSRRRPRVLGFEVSASVHRAVLCHLDGTVANSRKRVSALAAAPDTVARLAALGGELLDRANMSWSDLAGVGIALPGLVDAAQGIVRWSRPFDWHAVDFRGLCAAHWNTPTDVLNNAVAGSMAEHTFGVGRDMDSLIYVFVRFDVVEPAGGAAGISVRLGSGIIIHGEPYHGEFGAAGEITSLIDHPRVLMREPEADALHNTDGFIEALRAGNAKAVAAMGQVGDDIGAHVMAAINFLDPGMVIIDSDRAVLGQAVMQRLNAIVEADALRRVVGRTRVMASSLGEFGIAQGAAVPALARVFRLPRLGTERAGVHGDRSRQFARR